MFFLFIMLSSKIESMSKKKKNYDYFIFSKVHVIFAGLNNFSLAGARKVKIGFLDSKSSWPKLTGKARKSLIREVGSGGAAMTHSSNGTVW